MDMLQDDFYIGRNDFVGGIDNEALDFSQLEDFINNEDESDNTYFVDTLGHHEAGRTAPGNNGTTVVVVEATTTDDGGNREAVVQRLPLQSTNAVNTNTIPSAFAHSHNLPESPPDSGSEPPYSPQQDGGDKHTSHSKHSSNQLTPQEILLHPSHPSSLYSHAHLTLKQPHVHALPPTHLPCESMLMQHPILTPLLSANSTAILNTSSRSDAILLNRNETAAILEMGTEARSPLLNGVLNASIGSPVLLNHPSQVGSPPTSVANPVVQSIPASFESTDGDAGISTIYSSLQGNAKKRKLSDDANSILYVKQEKQEPNLDLSPESNSSQNGIVEDGYDLDGNVYVDSNFQCIRFQAFQQTQWHVLCDQNLKELPVPHYRVDADKGFNFSNADDAFVCQKKNHFQITCHTQLLGDAQFIKTPEGVKKIASFYLHFYGVKVESPTQTIKVEQSQSDRSKKPFHPVLVELQGEQVTKVTVGRLHFSETTSNNMRKKGKPNPDQRYFYLVVGLHAHTCDSNYQVVAHASERIIVRASNPGQFESDVELCWQKGHTSDSIFHAGRVGINTDRPDECLVVHGNLKVTGHIVQPSDLRAKLHLQECNTVEQLRNIEQLRVVKYRYADEFAERLGIAEDTGVIAQEVQTVLPDAVRPGGDINLPNGEIIRNFLVVNKDRIFMENLGAVKELCKRTDHLGKRIEEVEKMNRKLAKLKKVDSIKSTSSCSTVSSKLSSIKVAGMKSACRSAGASTFKPTPWVCSNRVIHIAIGILVIIMAICLAAMATLYILQTQEQLRQKQHEQLYSPFSTHKVPPTRSLTPKTSWPTLSTSLGNFLDGNRTRLFKERLRERAKSTRLLPIFQHTHRSDATHTEPSVAHVPHPSLLRTTQGSPRVLGRPPQCIAPGPSLTQEGHDSVCQSHCCSGPIEEAALLPTAYEEDSPHLSNVKHNEVESPPPASVNTIDHGDQTSKKGTVGVNRNNRSRRNAEDVLEPENSHFEPQADGDINGVAVNLYGRYLNQTLTSEFCAPFVHDFPLCLDKTSYNFTYQVLISRYFQDEWIHIEFQLDKSKNRSEVQMCQQSFLPMDCSVKRPPVTLPTASPNLFPIEFWNQSSANVKYRVPLSLATGNLCDANKQDLGLTYLEYNLYFYRECDE